MSNQITAVAGDSVTRIFVSFRKTALALTAILIGFSYWRTRNGFLKHAFLTNTTLMVGGFIFAGYQLAGYFVFPQ